jgi:hypothetical protein
MLSGMCGLVGVLLRFLMLVCKLRRVLVRVRGLFVRMFSQHLVSEFMLLLLLVRLLILQPRLGRLLL